MKQTLLLLAATLFLMGPALAQNIKKTITIEDDGSGPTVTIETTENGETTVETLTGNEAEAYIENEVEEGMNAKKITAEVLQEIDEELTELSEEIDKMVVKVVEIDIDSLKHDIEQKVEIHKQCVKEQLNQAYW